MDENPPIATSCRDCIFSIVNDNIQIGCRFDRLDKFKENGADVVMDKNHFLIIGRFCNTCRNEEWGRNNPRRKWMEIVKERIRVQVDIIINIENCNDLSDIMNTVDSAYNQKIKPKSVIIAYNSNTIPIETIVNSMRGESRGEWRIEQLCWEESAKYCKGSYYAVFNAGYIIPNYFIEKINKALNEDMIRFVSIMPDRDGNGLVMINAKLSLSDIHNMAENTNSGHMIKDFSDL